MCAGSTKGRLACEEGELTVNFFESKLENLCGPQKPDIVKLNNNKVSGDVTITYLSVQNYASSTLYNALIGIPWLHPLIKTSDKVRFCARRYSQKTLTPSVVCCHARYS